MREIRINLILEQSAEYEQRRGDTVLAQRNAFFQQRNAEPSCARFQRRARDRYRAMPIAICFHHGH